VRRPVTSRAAALAMVGVMTLAGATASAANDADHGPSRSRIARLPATSQQGNHCIVSVSGMAFGSYNTHSPTPLDSQGVVTVRCRGGQARSFIVEIGAGGSGRVSQRSMSGPGGTVRYNLYIDAVRHTIWGDGSNGSRTLRRNDARNRTITTPIYARVPAGQPVAAGAYQDTLAVTVIF